MSRIHLEEGMYLRAVMKLNGVESLVEVVHEHGVTSIYVNHKQVNDFPEPFKQIIRYES